MAESKVKYGERKQKWFAEFAELETMMLAIVHHEGDVQFAAVKGIMLKVAHMPDDVEYVAVMTMMLAIARLGNKLK